ncbi:MAG: glycogen/starch synthase [Chitinophagales bacterium]|jgi:starch synthase|nr:glycogen/starch synthase [Sphingobacteriales bacterium]
MTKRKLLFLTSELEPFNNLSDIATKISELPNELAGCGLDVRILMPRFGTINERRHKLHEVVRLSGINVMFNDEDFALTVKVASLPNSKHRLQIYFLHNDDFYNRKNDYLDDDGKFYDDNSERMIFFNRGIMETVRKFGWAPDFIICNGWMTSLVPFYARTAYGSDPIFTDSKIFFNIFDEGFKNPLEAKFLEKALLDGAIKEDKGAEFKPATHTALCKGAIQYADAIILNTHSIDSELNKCIMNSKKPTFNRDLPSENPKAFFEFIDAFKPIIESEGA